MRDGTGIRKKLLREAGRDGTKKPLSRRSLIQAHGLYAIDTQERWRSEGSIFDKESGDTPASAATVITINAVLEWSREDPSVFHYTIHQNIT